MAIRRSNNFMRRPANSRSNFRRFRPTGTDRKTRPTAKYEWGEFFVESTDQLPVEGGAPGDTNVFMVQLARTNAIGDTSDGQGRALIQAVRHLDIGGVVLDYGIEPATEIVGDITPGLLRMYWMVALVVDRVDGDGVPAALAQWDPFQSGTPVVGVTTITPQTQTFDVHRPQRMLWQRTGVMDFGARQIVDQQVGALYVPNDQRVEIRHATLNRKLKARLTDDLGLYIVRAYRATAVFDSGETTFSAHYWTRGSIYYRFGF